MGRSLGELDWSKLDGERLRRIRYSSGPHKTSDDMRDMIRMLKTMSSNRPSYGGHHPQDSRQECIVKVVRGRSYRSHAEHVFGYLPQEGKSKVWDKPSLFGNCTPDEYREKMSSKYFHMVVSPAEPMSGDELESFTRSYMERVSTEVCLDLVWQAAVHTDTGHPHVHIVINGKDAVGRQVKLPRDFICRNGREISRDMLTVICGSRSVEEISFAESNRLRSRRWTRIDNDIKAAMIPDGQGGGFIASSADHSVMGRMEAIEQMGLAKKTGSVWRISPSWEETLRANGRYGFFLDAKCHVPDGREYKLYGADCGEIEGKILKSYRMDGESIWTNALLVDTGQTVYFVPTWSPKKECEGQYVKVSARSGQTGKLVIKTERTVENREVYKQESFMDR